MPSSVRRKQYDPYRRSGYSYDGSAIRVVDGQAAPKTRPEVKPRRKQKQKPVSRPKVRVREPGSVAPFAVGGFAIVACMAVMILNGFVRLSTLSDEMVGLRHQMEELSSEEAGLLAQYDLAYDLGAIETAVTADGSMSRPQAGQTIYVDLTSPDSVVHYKDEESEGTASGFLDSIREIIENITSYF